uniref:Uncharacterized protein n=1 Tax=Plectus sambesii TaxID=2011161 RepID=A0A914UZ26_9BILA
MTQPVGSAVDDIRIRQAPSADAAPAVSYRRRFSSIILDLFNPRPGQSVSQLILQIVNTRSEWGVLVIAKIAKSKTAEFMSNSIAALIGACKRVQTKRSVGGLARPSGGPVVVANSEPDRCRPAAVSC